MKQLLALAFGLVVFQSCQKQEMVVNVETPTKLRFQKQIQRDLTDTIEDSNKKPFPVPFKTNVTIDDKVFSGVYQLALSVKIISPVPKNGWYFTYELYEDGKLVSAPYNNPRVKINPILVPEVKVKVLYDFPKNRKDKEYTLKVRVRAYGSIVNISESYFQFEIEKD
jgi:hypothetical protein